MPARSLPPSPACVPARWRARALGCPLARVRSRFRPTIDDDRRRPPIADRRRRRRRRRDRFVCVTPKLFGVTQKSLSLALPSGKHFQTPTTTSLRALSNDDRQQSPMQHLRSTMTTTSTTTTTTARSFLRYSKTFWSHAKTDTFFFLLTLFPEPHHTYSPAGARPRRRWTMTTDDDHRCKIGDRRRRRRRRQRR